MNNSTTIANQLLMECKETVRNSDQEMYKAITEICKNSNDEETRKIAIKAISKSNQYEKVFMIALAALGVLICVTQKSSELSSPTYVTPDTAQHQQQQPKVQLQRQQMNSQCYPNVD